LTSLATKGRALNLLKDKAKFIRKRGPQKSYPADFSKISSEHEKNRVELDNSDEHQEQDMS
jgi:hypothetical protein